VIGVGCCLPSGWHCWSGRRQRRSHSARSSSRRQLAITSTHGYLPSGGRLANTSTCGGRPAAAPALPAAAAAATARLLLAAAAASATDEGEGQARVIGQRSAASTSATDEVEGQAKVIGQRSAAPASATDDDGSRLGS